MNGIEIIWAILALQVAAVGGIGGLLWKQAENGVHIRDLKRRMSKVESKLA